jgi:hypothetical protein
MSKLKVRLLQKLHSYDPKSDIFGFEADRLDVELQAFIDFDDLMKALSCESDPLAQMEALKVDLDGNGIYKIATKRWIALYEVVFGPDISLAEPFAVLENKKQSASDVRDQLDRQS